MHQSEAVGALPRLLGRWLVSTVVAPVSQGCRAGPPAAGQVEEVEHRVDVVGAPTKSADRCGGLTDREARGRSRSWKAPWVTSSRSMMGAVAMSPMTAAIAACCQCHRITTTGDAVVLVATDKETPTL
ncbi:hypothetical protein ACFY3U_22455 [Micromonospora sp. NPDC000089]|uniref:hypothetical protein n=1 Tax=unclassified Micromonospora TaxID=2617518 RepID=UPI0036C85F34